MKTLWLSITFVSYFNSVEIEYLFYYWDAIKAMVTRSDGTRWSKSHLEDTHTGGMADKMDWAEYIIDDFVQDCSNSSVQDSQFIRSEV